MRDATLPRRKVVLLCRAREGGGAEAVFVDLARAFVEHGIDAVLVFACRHVQRVPETPSGVREITIGARNVAAAAPHFAALLRRERPDAILATLIAPSALAVACAGVVSPRPRVVAREANAIRAALAWRSPASRVIAGAVARAAYPRADAIVAVSEEAARELAEFLGLPRSRVTAIPNPAVTPRVLALAAETPAPAFAAAASPLIVGCGRLVAKKGFDVLIDAFAEVRRTRMVKLAVLGDGPLAGDLRARADATGYGEDVLLPGFVENPFAWFARAAVFVLSSFAEGMPNVLLQAMACGAPVVSTDCPTGPREILEDGAWGTLVAPGDASALADAIAHTLDAREKRDVRARAAQFALAPIAQRYLVALGLER